MYSLICASMPSAAANCCCFCCCSWLQEPLFDRLLRCEHAADEPPLLLLVLRLLCLPLACCWVLLVLPAGMHAVSIRPTDALAGKINGGLTVAAAATANPAALAGLTSGGSTCALLFVPAAVSALEAACDVGGTPAC
jgi:hypothetical protein